MPKVGPDFPNCRLEVRAGPREHAPPHFHIVTKDSDASFRIDTFKPMKGKLSKEGFCALDWARNNQVALKALWNELHKPRTKPR